ncbi:MAG: NAD(P)/FAD-dependent oxidoreductase [Gemmatimonadota bacterium]|jgi:putative flavoprotein involved in K+ transport
MQSIETVIIGGGQAGLAMSRSLRDHGIEHVLLERGDVGERWRNERWDSLRLLTPRWLSRLSGWNDDGADPHGFMHRLEVIAYLERYAEAFRAPVHAGVTVLGVERYGPGFRVDTDHGVWKATNVVIATGESQDAWTPDFARDLAGSIHQVVSTGYRNPSQLPDGGVLVVGASATGIQLAEEIHASGRPVTLSVARHTRLPRTYRGRDILEWFHRMGVLDERTGDVKNLGASRAQPSMQLIGSLDHRTLDLGVLQRSGIRLVGMAVGACGRRMRFADDLVESIAAAELKLASLRLRIDRHIVAQGLGGEVAPSDPFVPVPLPDAPGVLDLEDRGIRTILWATGFRRSYPWLRVPALDVRGEIMHTGGVTSEPGLYVLGLNFLRRRSSSFIAGVSKDADELVEHMSDLRSRRRPRAVA